MKFRGIIQAVYVTKPLIVEADDQNEAVKKLMAIPEQVLMENIDSISTVLIPSIINVPLHGQQQVQVVRVPDGTATTEEEVKAKKK